MSIRYFTDEHVAGAVVSALRKRGVDVLTVADAGSLGVDDADLFSFAQEKGRVIVTQDRDFLRIAAQQRDHPGVVYAPQGRSIGELVRMLDLLTQVSDATEMRGRIEFV